MILPYFLSFCRTHKTKTILLITSVMLFFGLTSVMLHLGKSLPEITSLPFKGIGVETIIQKSGKIPEKMIDAVFPHSNGPIYENEVEDLAALEFAVDYDKGLFFWYFDSLFFKSALGVDVNGSIFPELLDRNLEKGNVILDSRHILITSNFGEAHKLTIDDPVTFGEDQFIISGILRSSPSGNIIPADIYMDLGSARKIVINSEATRSLYNIENKDIVNVVTIKTDPRWKGDKEKEVKALDRDYLVFSEKTFSHDIENQIAVISAFGKIMFFVLGFIILLLYGLLTFFNFKTREKEVAILRIIGWPMKKLKGHFIAESLIFLSISLVLGNLITAASLFFISTQRVSMELPWDISAKPHFLPRENAINRTITTFIPVRFDWSITLVLTLAFVFVFGIVILLLFSRIKNIKPFKYFKE